MIKLPTSTKITIAQTLYHCVRVARTILGRPGTKVICNRNGVRWSLDISEGIDLAIYLAGSFEKGTLRSIHRALKPGMTVLDIGANIGAHCLPMAKRVGSSGRVIAIEPTDFAFSKLEANLALNPSLASSVTLKKMILLDPTTPKPEHLYSSWSLTPGGEKHPKHVGTLHSSAAAEGVTLDQLVEAQGLDRLDFIKLDVDGFECKVLRGATQTLKKFKPPMMIELCSYGLEEHGDSMDELLRILSSHGYQLYEENGTSKLPMNSAELNTLIPENGGINAMARV